MFEAIRRYWNAARSGAVDGLQKEAGNAVANDIKQWREAFQRQCIEDERFETAVYLNLADIYSQISEDVGGNPRNMNASRRETIVAKLHKNAVSTAEKSLARSSSMKLLAYYFEVEVRPGLDAERAYHLCQELIRKAIVRRDITNMQFTAITGKPLEPINDSPFR